MKHRLLISIYLMFCLSSCQENYSNALVLHYYQLDESLKKSNEFIHAATIGILRGMEETCKTKVQYWPLFEKAQKVMDYTRDLSEFIDALKVKMIKETEGIYTEEDALAAQDTLLKGMPKGAKNTAISSEILLTGTYEYQKKLPKAVLLDQKIQALSEQYIALLESCWQQTPNGRFPIKGTLFSDIRNKARTVQQVQNQFTLKSSKDFIRTQEHRTWAESTFGNKPLILVLNHLTAIQNQLETTQYALVDFFSSQVPPVDFNYPYDKFEILAYSPQSSVRLGETYKTEIALGAYSSKSVFQVVINQDTMQSIDGKVIYRVRPNKVGAQKYKAQISITYPLTGETETFSKEFSFHVIP